LTVNSSKKKGPTISFNDMAHYMIAFGKFNVTSTVVKGLFSVQLKKKR